jgi:hypothetical protein
MTIVSQSICTEPEDKPLCNHHHAISDVNYGLEPCQRGPALTLPVSYLLFRAKRGRIGRDRMASMATFRVPFKISLLLTAVN